MPVDVSPSVIVFDVNETLLDLATLSPVFDRVFGDAVAMREWFAQLILYSQTLTLSGVYTPFGKWPQVSCGWWEKPPASQ